jgi:hypothetical protein
MQVSGSFLERSNAKMDAPTVCKPHENFIRFNKIS